MWAGNKGHHVRSMVQGTDLSQGLIMPLQSFSEVTNVIDDLTQREGKEIALKKVMEMSFDIPLNVRKWQLSPAEAKRSLGPPPAFVPKTNLERAQNYKSLFTTYLDAVFQESTKMDGASMSIYYVRRDSQWYRALPPLGKNCDADMTNGRIGVCSRRHDLPVTPGLWWDMALRYDLPNKLARINHNVVIQGELCGSTINGNREGFARGQHDFFVFRMFEIDTQTFIHPQTVHERAKTLGLKHVPVHCYARLHDMAKNQEDLLRRAEGKGIFGNNREGLVYKNCADGRAFKSISNSYLLKIGE
ncbi:RNA ligase, DRB0094 family [Xylariaceae sp. FL1651]|nr:RNA ligase, DRB0094 family [Xylariaceae sp. FL1651]